MNSDPLIIAAERLGVPITASAGRGTDNSGRGTDNALHGIHIWAHWPRDRLEIAHDTLERIMEIDDDAELALDGDTGLWRARCGTWTFSGPFDEAVAMVALHVAERHGARPASAFSLQPSA